MAILILWNYEIYKYTTLECLQTIEKILNFIWKDIKLVIIKGTRSYNFSVFRLLNMQHECGIKFGTHVQKCYMFKTCENLRCTASDWQIRFPINLLTLLINDCDTVARCAIQINYVYFHYECYIPTILAYKRDIFHQSE